MSSSERQQQDGVGIGTVVVVSGIVSVVVSLLVALTVAGLSLAVWRAQALDETAPEPVAVEVEPVATEGEEEGAALVAVDADWETVVEGSFVPDDRDAHLYRFELPIDTVHVRADLSAGDVDLDLRIAFGEQEARDEEWRVTADGSTGDEYAWIARHDEPDFGRKPFMVRVDCYAEPDTDVDYELELTVVRYEVTARLRPGSRTDGTVSPESGHRTAFEVVMPEDVDVVRVDVVDARQDIDLGADVRPVVDVAHAAVSAVTPLGRESLLLERDALRLGRGEHTLHVAVVERGWNDRIIPFEIAVSAGPEPPEAARRLPELPTSTWAEEQAAFAIVGIRAGEGEGSGVVVGPERRILTAAHVVEELELDEPEVVVLVTTDLERAPLEALKGKVVRIDHERDLAVVEIVSTLHDEPLQDGWRLPAVAAAWDQPNVLGRPVHACGYPVLHDGDDRSELTWTSGVLSGYERPHRILLLRFDAEISSGSSGGALLDERHRLIGITTAMHGDLSTFSATGLALPLAEIPADWQQLLR